MILNKKISLLFLIIYFFLGSFYSLKTGITVDEEIEQEIWETNVRAVKGLYNDNGDYQILENYPYRYYGIGFQILSQPIQYPIKILIKKYQNVDDHGAQLLSKHFTIFLIFFISGIFFYKIIKKINNNRSFSYLFTSIYMLYPYLLGHGFYNPKDMPFLGVWIICTFISFLLSENFLKKDQLKLSILTILALSTGYLISIRISGILIFIQYFITFIILSEIKKEGLLFLIKKYFKEIIFFISITLLIIYISYPFFWKNPLEFIKGIFFMGKFPYATGCTMLFGKCIPAQNISPSYIPLWLIIKLPLIILFGLLLIPFTEKKIFNNDLNKIFFGSILITVFLIPILLIFKKVVLYDELRQILFLIPLFFILGLTSLYYFSKKISFLLCIFFLSFFIYENIKIYPYQYSWLNIPARFNDINKNFDSDYWSVSGRNLSNYLSTKKEIYKQGICVFGHPFHSFKPFLDREKFYCFKPDSQLHKSNKRPFIGIQIGRNLRRSIPNRCKTIKEEEIHFLFHKDKIIAGRLIYCSKK